MKTHNLFYRLVSVIVLVSLLSAPGAGIRATSAQTDGPVTSVGPPLSKAWSPPVDETDTATISQPAASSSTTTDPSGDLGQLNWLKPHPGVRDMTIVGNTATVLVPTRLIGDPASFYWYAGADQPSTGYSPLDWAPNSGTILWTSGSSSSTTDPVDGSLQPHEDVTFVSVSQADSTHIQFEWRFRGDIPAGQPDVVYYFVLNNLDWIVYLYPTVRGWEWEVDARNASFDWYSVSYEDIVSASVNEVEGGQLQFEMTTASTIPETPFSKDGEPWFCWKLDVDNNSSTGQQPFGDDMNVVVRFDWSLWWLFPTGWEGVVRKWNGTHYEDLLSVPFTRAGSTVSATVNISDLGLSPTFRWAAETVVLVQVPEEFFWGDDRAPDSGWVEMSLTPGNDPPSITTATLEHGPALPTNGENGNRSSDLYVRVADPNGLSDIASVVVDLSPVGGTTQSLSEDWCIYPEDGLYCGTVRTYGDIATGDVTLPITVADKAGLQDAHNLEVKVIMLMYDILQALGQAPDSILGQEVWIAALPADSFDPDVITAGTELVEIVHMVMKPSLLGLMEAIALKLATGWTHAQLFLGTHYHEYTNILLVSWKLAMSGADFLPLGIPHYLKVKVSRSDLLDFDYLEVLASEEDKPSPTHPYYALPTGYAYYDYRDVALSAVAYGAKACTMGVITERYRLTSDWPSHAFLRLQLEARDVPFVVRIPASEPAPNLGDLALVCGTKQQESAPVYDSDELGLLYDNLDTTQGSGSVIPIRSVSTSVVYGHEFLGDSTMAAALECPADLHIYDAQGRHTGAVYDAGGNVIRIDREIPDTTYLYGAGDTKEVALVSNPVSSPYTITVQGTGAGTYTETMTIKNRQGSQTYYRSDAAVPTANGWTDTVLVAEIPAAPTGLELSQDGGTIYLDWEDNTEGDLAGYNVYRSTQVNGVYEKMNSALLAASSFTDNSADEYTAYYYYVTAEDTGHNESGHLTPVASRYLIYLPLVAQNY